MKNLLFDFGTSKIEATNSTSAKITVQDVKRALIDKNPTIFFNDAESRYFIFDFCFTKNKKTFWIESTHISGDFSKMNLNIYE